MTGISGANLKILQAIREYLERRGISPSLEDLKNASGLRSDSTILFHLKKLEDQGFIRRVPGMRGIELVEKSAPVLSQIPLKGYVSAGKPIEAALIDEMISVPSDALRSANFALIVRGDSMIDEHICDGDLLVVKSQQTAKNNDTVIALINGAETTVKKFFRESSKVIRLQPANALYKPIYIKPPQTIEIQGVVVRIFRNLEH